MRFSKQSGQAVVEYVLLMIVTASMAALLVKGLVSRNPDNPGILVSRWCLLLESIGNDLPEDAKSSTKVATSNCPRR